MDMDMDMDKDKDLNIESFGHWRGSTTLTND